METRFTKGEWYTEHEMDNSIIISTDSLFIAQVYGTDHGEVDNETLANAKLIAAAPDLLNALMKCIDVVKQWHGEEAFEIYLNHSPEMKPISEAIKKATE